MLRKFIATLVAVLSISAVGVAKTDGTGFTTKPCDYPTSQPLPGGSGVVHEVGAGKAYATIAAAVAVTEPGDTVLVYPGVYNERVDVKTDAIRIRGTDRNAVIMDGGSSAATNGLRYGIYVNDQDYVVVENMTGRNYRDTAFFWVHAHGYMGRYLTVYNNPVYGVYAFDARCGQFDHIYGSGNGDSAIYIGECFPCDAVVTDSIAEGNGLGYSGTNAGGNLILQNSIWRDNGLGIVPNSLDSESNPPQRGAIIRNNIVENNNNKLAPGAGLTGQFWGGGIVLAGGVGNQVIGNTVTDHALGGIITAPLPDANLWVPSGNTVWGNTVSHDAEAHPDSLDLAQNAVAGPNNCWSFNTVATVSPPLLQDVWSCQLPTTPPGGDPRVEEQLALGFMGLNGRVPTPSAQWPAPGPQVNMPDDDGNASYADDGAIDAWIPTVL